MNPMLRARAASILAELLNLVITPDDNPVRSQVANWDSLRHIELILLLEEKFNIRFSIREVAGMNSLDDIVKLIEVKG